MTVVLSPDHDRIGWLKRTDGSERLLPGEQLLLLASRRCEWVFALGVERREVLLASADLCAFEPLLAVVERNIIVRFGSREDAPDLRLRYFEERGSNLLLAALADLANEGLSANVLSADLLEEIVFDSVAERRSANALAVGDGGVDALFDARTESSSARHPRTPSLR